MLLLLALTFGTYRVGYGTEVRTLELQSSNRYAYTSQGCFHRDVTRGAFRVEGDTLFLTPLPEDELGCDRYRIIPWGDETLLVEDAELATLAEEVRKGWHGSEETTAFLRLGKSAPLSGPPPTSGSLAFPNGSPARSQSDIRLWLDLYRRRRSR